VTTSLSRARGLLPAMVWIFDRPVMAPPEGLRGLLPPRRRRRKFLRRHKRVNSLPESNEEAAAADDEDENKDEKDFIITAMALA